jgi:Contractile injection system tube protein
MSLVKAKLYAIKGDPQTPPPETDGFEVQFNPETLKISYSNQIESKGANSGQPKQFISKRSAKLGVQLVFDTSGPSFDPSQMASDTEAKKLSDRDVRKMTKKVIDLINPDNIKQGSDAGKKIALKVRLLWGSFKFDGIMESLEESLEFFAPEGIPLRATLTLSLTEDDIKFQAGDKAGTADQASTPGAPASTPGVQPLTSAPANANLPSLANQLGTNANWQGIAAANGIENPRRLVPGQLIDMNAKPKLEF